MKNSFYSFTILIGLMAMGIYYFPETESSFELIWEDQFEMERLDSTVWTPVIGNGCPELCGWGNNELQYYSDQPNNLRIKDGILIIQAHKQDYEQCGYTSAKVVTKGKADWKWGKIAVMAKLPYGKGTWPAIWMLPTVKGRSLQWPQDGEIDIMEHVGYNHGVIYGNIHTEKYNHILGTDRMDSVLVSGVSDTFHEYAIEWTENEIKWLVDDNIYHTLSRENDSYGGWPFNQYNYHLILNLAVGGNWGGKHGVSENIWPQTLEIDYVRYYQLKD